METTTKLSPNVGQHSSCMCPHSFAKLNGSRARHEQDTDQTKTYFPIWILLRKSLPINLAYVRTQLTFCNGGILRLMQFALSFLNRKSRYVRTYVHTIFSQREWPRSTIFASVLRPTGFATFRWMVADGRDHSNVACRLRACVGLRHVLEVINVYAIPSSACP